MTVRDVSVNYNFLPVVDNELGPLEEFVKDFGLVQFREEFSLQVLLGMVYESQSDCLRYHIDHLSLDDVEVRMVKF